MAMEPYNHGQMVVREAEELGPVVEEPAHGVGAKRERGREIGRESSDDEMHEDPQVGDVYIHNQQINVHHHHQEINMTDVHQLDEAVEERMNRAEEAVGDLVRNGAVEIAHHVHNQLQAQREGIQEGLTSQDANIRHLGE